MSEAGSSSQVVERGGCATKSSSSFNICNLLLVGGLGYVIVKTFLLEERVNDLTVLMKRQTIHGDGMRVTRTVPPHVPPPSSPPRLMEEYETSSDDDSISSLGDEKIEDVRVVEEEGEEGEEQEEQEVLLEEQPAELPPQQPDTPPTSQNETRTSSFVTTRQRKTASESRGRNRS